MVMVREQDYAALRQSVDKLAGEKEIKTAREAFKVVSAQLITNLETPAGK